MIQLLCVLVKHVCVPFRHWHIGDFVNLVHNVVEGFKDRARLDVFVVITGDDDAGKRVKPQKGFNERLKCFPELETVIEGNRFVRTAIVST